MWLLSTMGAAEKVAAVAAAAAAAVPARKHSFESSSVSPTAPSGDEAGAGGEGGVEMAKAKVVVAPGVAVAALEATTASQCQRKTLIRVWTHTSLPATVAAQEAKTPPLSDFDDAMAGL